MRREYPGLALPLDYVRQSREPEISLRKTNGLNSSFFCEGKDGSDSHWLLGRLRATGRI